MLPHIHTQEHNEQEDEEHSEVHYALVDAGSPLNDIHDVGRYPKCARDVQHFPMYFLCATTTKTPRATA
jgi:hypothetical protein